MRFMANENFPAAAVEALRDSGHDVVWVSPVQGWLSFSLWYEYDMVERARGKPRLYLETSIPSAYWDDRDPARMAKTKEFWQPILTRSGGVSSWISCSPSRCWP